MSNVIELRLLDHCVHPMCYVMDVMTNLRQYYSNSHKITKREDISNPFEVLERQTLEVENIVGENKYLTILFFSQLYTHLHTCQKSHPPGSRRRPTQLVWVRWCCLLDAFVFPSRLSAGSERRFSGYEMRNNVPVTANWSKLFPALRNVASC